MKSNVITSALLAEFEAEVAASRKCVERVPEKLYEYKPHPKSMAMEYLTLLVAEIPKWIAMMIDDGNIDLSSYQRAHPKTTNEMVDWFDKCVEDAKRSLQRITDQDLQKEFTLMNKGQMLMKDPLSVSIPSTINHWVHHRGQLTVYLRLNDIDVPSIYGPSADDKGF